MGDQRDHARRRVTLAEATKALCVRANVTPAERVGLSHAVGRVLAEPVAAREGRPLADESAMDGYAVRAADTASSPAVLTVVGESRAGMPWSGTLSSGQAIRISTGALVPTGADAVVRQEDTVDASGFAVTVTVDVAVGRDVRRAGEDWRAGAPLVAAGLALTAHALAPLAGAGAATVEVRCRPRVAVVATGDEILDVGSELEPGQVRDTSTTVLPAMVRGVGGEVVHIGRAVDDRVALRAALDAALAAGPDLLLISGGASVGPHDLVRPAVAALGFDELFGGVAIKPGGPAWAASRDGGPLVIGLPGNPVASVVTARLLAVPFIHAALGHAEGAAGAGVQARVAAAVPGAGPRAHAVRGYLVAESGGWVFTPASVQGSHQLVSLLDVNAVGLVPAGVDGTLDVGTIIDAYWLS